MATSTQENTVPETGNETPEQAGARPQTTKSALEHFGNMGASGPESWRFGASALGSY